MNNFPTAENIWFVEAHTCFQLFNFVCLAAISLKVSAKLTRNKFKNITASYLLTSYIISSVRMLIMSNPVLFTMDQIGKKALTLFPYCYLKHRVGAKLIPPFILLCRILTLRIIFEFYFRKKKFFFIKQKLLETMKK